MVAAVANANTAVFMSNPFQFLKRTSNTPGRQWFPVSTICEGLP
jgi:hypothetical protein